MYTLCDIVAIIYKVIKRPINLGYRDCKHEQLDRFLAQALEIVEIQCSKSLDG